MNLDQILKYAEQFKAQAAVLAKDVPYLGQLIKDMPAGFIALIGFIFGLAVISGIYSFIQSMHRRASERMNTVKGPEAVKKRAISEAKKLARKKEHGRAAETLMSVGETRMAAEVLEQGGVLAKAGQLYEAAGDLEKAVQLYAAAGENQWLAEAHMKLGNHAKAAETFLKSGKKILAAEAFEKAGAHDMAAKLFDEAGHTLSAAIHYEKCKNYPKAAALYERAYVEAMSTAEGANPANRVKLDRMLKRAGELYMQSNDPERAAEAFARCEAYVQAGEAALKLGRRERAAEYFHAGKDYDRAAAIYREDGNVHRACEVMAEKYIADDRIALAGDMFMESGMFLKAAEQYDQAGDFGKAGEAYLKLGEYGAAADSFYKAGLDQKAAETFALAGNYKHAAEVYMSMGERDKAAAMMEKSGDYMGAAQVYKDLQMSDREVSALQKVGAETPGYVDVASRLAGRFKAGGNLKLAAETYIRAIGKDEPNVDNIELFYGIGTIFEAAKKYPDAIKAYHKAQMVEFGYKDIADRVKECEKYVDETQMTSSRGGDDLSKRYTMMKEVGRGGMGVVYQAKDNNLNRIVALKVLPQHISDTPTVIKRFASEARSAAQLNHPNIVTLYDFNQSGGKSFITMEYVEGITLKRLCGAEQKVPIVNVLKIIYQCCQGLDYAHKKGIIHRDIKPSNIMISKQNVVKIMDFGLAKVVGEETITEAGMVSGTVLYMSPEQLMGKPLDFTTDLYALGLVLYELLTGIHPFAAGDPAYHHLNTVPAPPSAHRPGIPPQLDRIVLKSLEKDRTKRFPGALHMAASFKEVPLK